MIHFVYCIDSKGYYAFDSDNSILYLGLGIAGRNCGNTHPCGDIYYYRVEGESMVLITGFVECYKLYSQ